MNRNLYLMLGAAGLIAMAACTVKTETSGTGGSGGHTTTTTHTTSNTGGSGNTGNTGGGGSGACITCATYVGDCQNGNCPDSNTICAGASDDAYLAMAECACGQCLTQCPAEVCPNGTGTGGAAACEDCQAGALTSACSGELSNCMTN